MSSFTVNAVIPNTYFAWPILGGRHPRARYSEQIIQLAGPTSYDAGAGGSLVTLPSSMGRLDFIAGFIFCGQRATTGRVYLPTFPISFAASSWRIAVYEDPDPDGTVQGQLAELADGTNVSTLLTMWKLCGFENVGDSYSVTAGTAPGGGGGEIGL